MFSISAVQIMSKKLVDKIVDYEDQTLMSISKISY